MDAAELKMMRKEGGAVRSSLPFGAGGSGHVTARRFPPSPFLGRCRVGAESDFTGFNASLFISC